MPDRPLPAECEASRSGGHSHCQVAGCGCGCVPSARWMHDHLRRADDAPRRPA